MDCFVPFIIQIQQQTIRLDTTEIFIKPKNYALDDGSQENMIDGGITEKLQVGSIFLSVYNHFPIGVQFKLNMSQKLSRLHDDPDFVIGPINIQPGKSDNDGCVTEEILTAVRVDLSHDDVAIFKNGGNSVKNLWVAPEITLPGTSEAIMIHADDYVRISGYAKLQLSTGSK